MRLPILYQILLIRLAEHADFIEEETNCLIVPMSKVRYVTIFLNKIPKNFVMRIIKELKKYGLVVEINKRYIKIVDVNKLIKNTEILEDYYNCSKTNKKTTNSKIVKELTCLSQKTN